MELPMPWVLLPNWRLLTSCCSRVFRAACSTQQHLYQMRGPNAQKAYGITLACLLPELAMADSADYPIVVVTRASERIVVVIAGVVALVLGYRLFDKAADLGALTAEVPQRIKLQMQRIGPGIFFALFGTAILIYVMSSNIDVSPPGPVGTTASALRFSSPVPEALSSKEKSAQVAHAIEVMKTFAAAGPQPQSKEDEQRRSDAIQLVESVQAGFVDFVVGSGAYGDWKIIHLQELAQPSFRTSLSSERRGKFDAVERVINEGKP
jgi:hypothetical protein